MNDCGSVLTRRKFVYSTQAASIVDEAAKAESTLDEVLAPYSINVFDIQLK